MAATLIFHKAYVTIADHHRARICETRKFARVWKQKKPQKFGTDLPSLGELITDLLQFPDTHMYTCSYR